MPKRKAPSNVVLVLLAVVVLASAAFAVAAKHLHDERASASTAPRASGLPASVDNPLAYLMGLSAGSGRPAPDFTLTDQHGATLSLRSLRGHVVVLGFMDPHCTDICPIVSRELIDAAQRLGTTARNVDFVSINVNQYHRSVADMTSFSAAHGLSSISTWHFVTGPTAALRAAWHDYGVAVIAPNPNADIIHTSVIYFIDAKGVERYVAFPMDDHTASGAAYLPAPQISSWGRGIALVASAISR